MRIATLSVALRPTLLRAMAGVMLWLLCTLAMAAPYGNYEMRQLLIPAQSGSGGSINARYLDTMLQDLAQHAGDYPVRFDSASDRQRAERDVTQLMRMLDAAFREGTPEPILLRMGMLGAIGHNLDLPQAAEYAQQRFRQLLALKPDHTAANFQYGRFLASSARLKEAIPYLEKARGQRVAAASYALGIVHLGLDDKAKALTYLVEYQEAEPKDRRVGQLIDAVRQGRVALNRSASP